MGRVKWDGYFTTSTAATPKGTSCHAQLYITINAGPLSVCICFSTALLLLGGLDHLVWTVKGWRASSHQGTCGIPSLVYRSLQTANDVKWNTSRLQVKEEAVVCDA